MASIAASCPTGRTRRSTADNGRGCAGNSCRPRDGSNDRSRSVASVTAPGTWHLAHVREEQEALQQPAIVETDVVPGMVPGRCQVWPPDAPHPGRFERALGALRSPGLACRCFGFARSRPRDTRSDRDSATATQLGWPRAFGSESAGTRSGELASGIETAAIEVFLARKHFKDSLVETITDQPAFGLEPLVLFIRRPDRSDGRIIVVL